MSGRVLDFADRRLCQHSQVNPRELIGTAAALAHAYAPSADVQSGTVAAALVTAAGHVYTGVCIDTACSLGFCAEHAAVAEMLKARECEITMIVAVQEGGQVLAPCGRCRELLWQLNPANRRTWIVLGPDAGQTLEKLLPQRWIE